LRSSLWGAILLLLLPSFAHAVVFDMSKEKFGAYLRGTYEPWGNGTDPFAQSSGQNVSAYEFGFLFNAGRFNWRLGLEIIHPPALSNFNGSDSSGNLLYTASSEIIVYTPKIGVEFNLKTWKESRLWVSGQYGYATLTVQNSYNFTPAGTTQFGIPSFREVVSGTQSDVAASLGFETLLTDSTTFSMEAGYRTLDFNNLNLSSGVTNFQGAQSGGATATQNNGGARSLDMTGPFASVNFRFWIN
jgi:hypothetical protein